MSGGSLTNLTPLFSVEECKTKNVENRASAKHVIVDRIQRLRSRFTRRHLGELRRHSMGTLRMSHISLGSVLLLSGAWHPERQQGRLLHRAFSVLDTHDSANTR